MGRNNGNKGQICFVLFCLYNFPLAIYRDKWHRRLNNHKNNQIKICTTIIDTVRSVLCPCYFLQSITCFVLCSLHVYCQISHICRTSVGNITVDHSDVDGASSVAARCSNYILILDITPGWLQWIWARTTARRDEKHLSFGIWWALYQGFDGNNLRT